jgi:hypothetical protein
MFVPQTNKKNKQMKKPYEYAKNRFIMNPEKVIDVSVYSKQDKNVDANGEYPVIWRVAYTIDVKESDKGTVYSDGFGTEAAAREHAMRPMGE